MIDVCSLAMLSSRSFGMTMSVSTRSLSRSMPCSAWTWRRLPSNANGRGDHADGQRAHLLGDLGHHGSGAGSGAAAFPGGDEHHVRALHRLGDLVAVLLGGAGADLGVAAGAEPSGQLAPDVQLDIGVAQQQGLGVGVDRDELDAAQADVDHAVDGVRSRRPRRPPP